MAKDEKSRRADELWALFFSAGLLVSFGAAVCGACVLGWQCLQWLRYGNWHPLEVRDGLKWADIGEPHLQWVGAQMILDGLLSFSLAFGLILYPFAAFLAIFMICEYIYAGGR